MIHDNNREYVDAWHSAGGLKVTESQGLEIRGNDVRRNDGPGIWTDLDVRDAVIAGNVVLDSMRSGIEIELSTDVITVDNVKGEIVHMDSNALTLQIEGARVVIPLSKLTNEQIEIHQP